jgi:S1-C subfamily serine protease
MTRSIGIAALASILAACSSSPNAAEVDSSPAAEATAPAADVSSGGSDQARIVRAVALARRSVVALSVAINGTRVVPANPLAPLFGGNAGPSLQPFREQASGSGFVYDASGLIVTNAHVVHGASKVTAVFANGDRVAATPFAEDVGADVALVKVTYGKLPPPLPLGNSNAVQQGEWAIAIGEPFELQQTVTVGVVSGFNRNETIGGEAGQPARVFKGLLQTSAPINPGNSGGPLIDMFGRVIGVNQSTASPTAGAQGIGFAIPVDALRSTVTNLIAHPGVHSGAGSGFIGVQLIALNDNVRGQLGYTGSGVAIAGVIGGSAADRAGLNPGDVIRSINGTAVNTPDDVTSIMSKTHAGDVVHLEVWSRGAVRQLDVHVTAAPETAAG